MNYLSLYRRACSSVPSGMTWVHILSLIMVQSVLMSAIIAILLKLLCVMRIHTGSIQVLHYIAQVFVQALLGFAHARYTSFPFH